MKIQTILTGATGMVGEGVLHECLQHPDVESVLVLGRNPCGRMHPKLKEIIYKDLYDVSPIADQLRDYNSCFFCLGTTSVGKKEPEFTRISYTLTMHIARILSQQNPQMAFSYISGAGTDSSEKGRMMWARVKGKTENDLMKLPFRKVYNFRPGVLSPTKGLKNTLGSYKWLGWLLPVIRLMAPRKISSLRQLGLALINGVRNDHPTGIFEVKDIIALSKEP